MTAQSVTARFNYTKRRRIDQESIAIEFSEANGQPFVSAKVLDSSVLAGLEPDAQVILEISRRTTLEQFPMGTVGQTLSLVDAPVNEFTTVTGIQARLKVVSVGSATHGKLIAVADRIQADGTGNVPGTPNPLILFQPSSSIGDETWVLDLSQEMPVVLMNERVDDWFGLASSTSFIALVYPELVRRIARWVADDFDAAEEEGTVRSKWVRFLNRLGTPLAEIDRNDPAAVLEWTDSCASNFSTRHDLLTKLIDSMEV